MSSDNQPDNVVIVVATTVADDSSFSCNAGHQPFETHRNGAQGNCDIASAEERDSSADVGTDTAKNDAGVASVNDNSSSIVDSEVVLHQGQLRSAPRKNDEVPHHISKDCILRSNYTSAHVSTLGADSDRMDFCTRPQISSMDCESQCEPRKMSEDDTNSVVSLKKIRKWFATSSSPGNDVDDACNGDYHSFGLKDHDDNYELEDQVIRITECNEKNTKQALDDNEFDESLLNGNKGMIGQTNRKIHPWVKQSFGIPHHPSNLVGTEEEERVMGECSFFYNNMDDAEMIKSSSQQRIPSTRSIAQSLRGEHPQDLHPHYRYRTRRLDPHLISNAIKTRAKRQWTERRYRRRLRQSQLGMVSFDGIANSESIFSKTNNSHDWSRRRLRQTRQDDSSRSFWHTKEHQRAFLAAHSALNGKLAYENGYNNNRKNTPYEYGIDDDYYDLELAITQDEDAEGGGGGESARAYVTKSSLAIRGGLIRLPTDNVRLVCDPMLQPGILSIETRELVATAGGGWLHRRYEDGVKTMENSLPHSPSISKGSIKHCNGSSNERRKKPNDSQKFIQPKQNQQQQQPQQWSRQELAYVLTVDERIYQRIVQEMGDSHRIPCGMYYCCHVTTGGDHVGIGVAVAILSLLFLLLIAGMIAWPTV